MTTSDDVFAPANIAGLAKRLYELRAEIASLQGEERNLTTILKEYCEKTGEVIQVEGQPDLKVKERGAGWFWDSTAIRNMQEQYPKEWERLVELGAVTLSSSVVSEALKHGQLLGRPKGGWEKKQVTLMFDR